MDRVEQKDEREKKMKGVLKKQEGKDGGKEKKSRKEEGKKKSQQDVPSFLEFTHFSSWVR